MIKVLTFTAVLTLVACSSAPAQGTGSSEAAARVGDRVITMKELEERWRASDPGGQAEVMQKVYEGRRTALEALVAELVVAEAAKANGMPVDAFLETEITKRIRAVSDADVVTFYQANMNQMQGRSLDQMAPVIKRFLEEQQRESARQALIAELRKSGPAVSVMFEAPRAAVAVEASDPALGPATAPVTIVEFSDFQCPFCKNAAPTLKRLKDAYGDKIRIVWKDFPLTQIHPQAFKAAEGAHCAGEQGKFWEYHDTLFDNQQALQPDSLKTHAKDMGLDAAKFDACLDSSKYAERVREGVASGSRLGVNSTPTLYVNGRVLMGAQPYEAFTAVIDEELARK